MLKFDLRNQILWCNHNCITIILLMDLLAIENPTMLRQSQNHQGRERNFQPCAVEEIPS